MKSIPMNKWGKDHWSTLAYAECCAVDDKGRMHTSRMNMDGDKYPTRIRDAETVQGHTDMDCVSDMETEGLLENIGTGINPMVKLTDKGWDLAGKLRQHKAEGGYYATFCEKLEELKKQSG